MFRRYIPFSDMELSNAEHCPKSKDGLGHYKCNPFRDLIPRFKSRLQVHIYWGILDFSTYVSRNIRQNFPEEDSIAKFFLNKIDIARTYVKWNGNA